MNNLRIRSESMLGTTHSWAVTLRSLLREFDQMGHELCLNSTNGYDLFPNAWEEFRKEGINADIDLTYTLPRNFKYRFNRNSKLKLAIYNYESSILPKVWSKEIDYIDFALLSSQFSKEVKSFDTQGLPFLHYIQSRTARYLISLNQHKEILYTFHPFPLLLSKLVKLFFL